MKKIIAIIVIAFLYMGCKSDPQAKETDVSGDNVENKNRKTDKQADGLIAVQGKFIYYADAAVLQTPARMFGVVINDKMHELNEQVKTYKNEPTDMVPITVRGKIFKKPEGEEGWEDRIEIIEILKVTPPNPEDNDVIKVGGRNTESSN